MCQYWGFIFCTINIDWHVLPQHLPLVCFRATVKAKKWPAHGDTAKYIYIFLQFLVSRRRPSSPTFSPTAISPLAHVVISHYSNFFFALLSIAMLPPIPCSYSFQHLFSLKNIITSFFFTAQVTLPLSRVSAIENSGLLSS